MVDCGAGSGTQAASKAVRALWSNGFYRLDGIILTHYDEDHVNGIAPFLVQMGADEMYMPDCHDKEGFRAAIEDSFRGTVNLVNESIVIPCGNGKISVFPSDPGVTGNESGLCILFQAADCDILITGDRNKAGELQLMEQADLPDLEALIVGHHGARSSTSLGLLRFTMPDVAIISVGEDNLYGHPEEETLNRLALFGCKILRTDKDGTIIIRR
jgi:competence protein ComEC